MKKINKKRISLFLSITLTASAVIGAGYYKVSEDKKAEDSPFIVDTQLPEEFFSALTVTGGELSADGKSAGSSYGGISLDEDSQLTFEDSGKKYSLSEAEEKLGVQLIQNAEGEDMIISPFSTASLIVMAEGGFDSCGAVSVTEKYDNLYLLEYSNIADSYAAYQKLAESGDVTYVEPDMVCTALEDNEKLVPEYHYDIDELGGWGAEAIGAKDFCEFLRKEKGEELPEVIVAIVDTGVNYDHAWLKDRIVGYGGNFVRDGKFHAKDYYGHGTHCAGIVCSSTNDNVKILPVKALNNGGGGTLLSVYSGIRYAVDSGADVISLSLGFYGRSNLLEDAVEYARQNNVAVCVAAGNEYCADSLKAGCTFPLIDYTVTVGSVGKNFDCSAFSNRGLVDFSAPGEKILSTYVGDDEDKCYILSGTSMATPFVAACFADMFSYDPNITVEDAYELIKKNALDICEEGFDSSSGWGMVNLRNFRFDDSHVEPPYADIPTGMYDEPISVSLGCNTENAEIFYTLDGSVPTAENGIKYNGEPIFIEETSTLRIVAVLDGIMSRYEDYKYYINEIDPSCYNIDCNGVLWDIDVYDRKLDLKKLTEDGVMPTFTAIGNSVFKRNNYIEEIILPDEVKIIDDGAFYGCGRLKKVTMNAEVIRKEVFTQCKNLEEINDSSILSIGYGAFNGCERLTVFDGKKLTNIPDKAFYGCNALSLGSFDTNIIESYGMDSFANSGISGTLDAAAVTYIGVRAFENTQLNEVLLPDNIEAIPERAFCGCSALKGITARGLKSVGKYGLALGKREFSPETAVKSDIDFSKLETAGNMAFEGYVFDKPECFDSLDENSSLIAFAGSYGTKLTFPTMSCITIGGYSDKDIDDVFADVIEVPNLVKFSNRSHIGRFGAMVIGDPETGVKLDGIYPKAFAEGGTLITYEENETVRQLAEKNGCEQIIAPCIYCPKENYILKKGKKAFVTAYSIGEGYTGEWYIKNGSSAEKLDISGDMPIVIEAADCGSFKYIYRQLDEENNIVNEKEIAIEIIEEEPASMKIEENGFDLIGEQAYCELDAEYRLYRGEFTAEKGGDYLIYTNRAKIICYENGETLFTGGTDTNSAIPAVFEAGKTYEINIILAPKPETGTIKTTGLPYIAIHHSDDTRKCLSALFRGYSINWDNFTGSENYRPDVYLNDSNNYLSQGYDFEVVFDEPPHYGTNKYMVRGIGRYFGIIDMGETELKEGMKPDEWYIADKNESMRFIPEEDGLYKLVICPEEDVLSDAEEYGNSLNYSVFDTLPEITGETPGVYGITYYKPGNGTVGNGFSMSPDMFSTIIEMKAGDIYTVSAGETKNRFMITKGNVLNECTVDYKKNYEYTGEAVTPEISIYAPNGSKLEEDKDYTVRAWSNRTPGIMYAYVEGKGKYPGCLCLAMTIEGGNTEAQANGDIRLIPEGDVKISPYMNYKLVIEKDTFMYVSESDGCNFYPLTVSSAENDFIAVIGYTEDGAFIPSGTYDVYSDCTDNVELSYELYLDDEVKNINDTEIILKDTEEDGKFPDTEVYFEGELLKEGEDYEVYGTYDRDYDISGIEIWGTNGFAGYVQVDHIPFDIDVSELPVLESGITEAQTSPSIADVMYQWIPEGERYVFNVETAYAQVYAVVMEENGRVVFRDTIDRFTSAEVDVVSGKRYIVSFTDENDYKLKLNISCNIKALEKCEAIYDSVAEYGTAEFPVIFKDGEKTLTEGVDYISCKNCGQAGIGTLELIFEGIGEYYGQVCVPVHLYTKEMPDEKAYELTEGYKYRVGNKDNDPGIVNVLKFTANREDTAEYRIKAVTSGRKEDRYTKDPELYSTMDAAPVKYSSVFVYDEKGGYLSSSDTLTLEKGETRYIVVVTPYTWDTEDRCSEKELDISVNYVKNIDDSEQATTTSTTSTATTETTTVSTETTTTSSEETTESTASLTTETTTASTVTSTEAATTSSPVTTEPSSETQPMILGDVNEDGSVDSSDASKILAEYAALQTGKESTLNDRQHTAADVNKDNSVDSSDASFVLAFYSYLQTGGTEADMEKWFAI